MRLALALLILLIHTAGQAGTLTGRVTHVTNGDTLVVLDAGKAQHTIRLQGIDAPDQGQAYGNESKEHLSDHVAGKFVVVEYDKRDRYKRVVGKVFLAGQDMNLGQVAAGLAWHYKKHQVEQTQSDRISYSDAEREARRDRRGLWHDPNPVPPWEFRKAKRERLKEMKPLTDKSDSIDFRQK